MTNRLTGDPSPHLSDDIVDAEFVEVPNWSASASTNRPKPQSASKPPMPPKKELGGCVKAAIVGIATVPLLFLVAMCAPTFPDSDDTSGRRSSAAPSDLPALATLLQQNDSRACSHPDVALFVRQQLLPGEVDPANATVAQMYGLARVALTEVTASGIKSDVHEISCEANLRYGDGATDFQPIAFKMRAAANPANPPVYYFGWNVLERAVLGDLILRGPKATVASEDQQQPEPEETPPAEEPQTAPSTEATQTTVSMTCTNWRRQYHVTFDPRARTIVASAEDGPTAYKVSSVEDRPEGPIVSGKAPGDGPTFVASFITPKTVTYDLGDRKQVDDCG